MNYHRTKDGHKKDERCDYENFHGLPPLEGGLDDLGPASALVFSAQGHD
jgi:hypothetical protein